MSRPHPAATLHAIPTSSPNAHLAKAVVEVDRSVDRLAAEWDELADRAGASPFVRPGWVGPWWRAFGSGRLEIVSLRADGRLAALIPLRRSKGVLAAAANTHTPLFGLVAEDGDAASALARAVLARRARRVSLLYMRPGDLEVFRSAASAIRRPAAAGYLEASPYVAVRGSWEDFQKGLDSKLLRDLRRRRRRLDEVGEVTIEVGDGREGLDGLLDEGFPLESSGWKAESGTSILSSPETQAFYREVAAWAAGRGILRLAFLRVDGRPLAFQLGVEDGGAYYFMKGGYDPEQRQFAPQKLLVQAVLERAFASGLESFEFLGEDEAWKLEWTDELRRLDLFHAFRPPLGLAEWAAVRLGPWKVARVLATRS
jgi:CelD/BcsL family acetyltransferase involved in cellulose biosynthesis